MNDAHAYAAPFSETFLPDEEYQLFDLETPDEKLKQLLIDELERDVEYWNKEPWKLRETDQENVNYLLGDQTKHSALLKEEDDIDNRLFTGLRAIMSYATGQLAVPELTPSRSDDQYLRMARSMQQALYQHSLDEHVDQKVRSAVMNLVVRKRGYLKLRYDPHAGLYGDIVTEVCNPEDIIIDRYAGFMDNPRRIYHRLHMTVDELCAKFPSKKAEILSSLSIKQARFTQMSRMVHPYECWFTYMDAQDVPREGVVWFLADQNLILDKMPNPNWVYTGDDMKDKEANVLTHAPKPFIWFNYLNLGHSFIDETCLFEQAKPMQRLLNQRLKQFNQNVDFANGRWVASRKAFSEEDATKFVNKGAKTIALVNSEDVGKSVQVLTPNNVAPQLYESITDARSEIDGLLGTPSIFKGSQPQSHDTLGRDMLVKQQAGMLQDDLVRSVQVGMESYYAVKLQLMRVFYTDDYWFQVKGGDGKFDFVMLNGDSIDSNVKIGVEVDSTLPLDKAVIRDTAMTLAKMNRIDQLTLLEDLGVPNPDIRTERLLRSQIDPYTYMQSVEQQMDNNDAEVDILLLIDGKEPQERDAYDEGYLNYFNHFLTTNRFTMLAQDVKKRLVSYLTAVQHLVTQSANLQGSMLNDAGIVNRPPIFPLPKRTLNIRLNGQMDPNQTHQIAGSEAQMFTPVTQAEDAQSPNPPADMPTPGQ